jgi:hypothetical protein
VIGMIYHGASAWARTFRIDTELVDGNLHSYFLKVSTTHTMSLHMAQRQALKLTLYIATGFYRLPRSRGLER